MTASSLKVWFTDAVELEEKVIGETKDNKMEAENVEEWIDVVEKKRKVAERLLAQYTQDYQSWSRGQRKDMKMIYATQKLGTEKDRVFACSVLVGENPIANLESLDIFLAPLKSKSGKHHAFIRLEALKELFISSLLPDRKLKVLLQQPLNNLPQSKDGYSLLLLWYWEECLKLRFPASDAPFYRP